MGETASDFDPPRWAGPTILGSTILAAVSYVVGGSVATRLAGGFAVLAFLCILYVLYLWGQHRDPPGGDGNSDREREKEMEAEAGGYGGSGGGA